MLRKRIHLKCLKIASIITDTVTFNAPEIESILWDFTILNPCLLNVLSACGSRELTAVAFRGTTAPSVMQNSQVLFLVQVVQAVTLGDK